MKKLLIAICMSLYACLSMATVVEVYNGEHYFITNTDTELQGLLQAGWNLTGETFESGGSDFVCRFYLPGTAAHFFTAHTSECQQMVDVGATLPTESYWQLEGVAFRATPPADGNYLGLGTCIGSFPVYHAYNPVNRGHRFTTNLKAILELVNSGWLWGDVSMCAPIPQSYPLMWNQPRENFLVKIEGCDELIVDRNGYTADANGMQDGPIDLYIRKCNVGDNPAKVWLARIEGEDWGYLVYGVLPKTMEVYIKRAPKF